MIKQHNSGEVYRIFERLKDEALEHEIVEIYEQIKEFENMYRKKTDRKSQKKIC